MAVICAAVLVLAWLCLEADVAWVQYLGQVLSACHLQGIAGNEARLARLLEGDHLPFDLFELRMDRVKLRALRRAWRHRASLLSLRLPVWHRLADAHDANLRLTIHHRDSSLPRKARYLQHLHRHLHLRSLSLPTIRRICQYRRCLRLLQVYRLLRHRLRMLARLFRRLDEALRILPARNSNRLLYLTQLPLTLVNAHGRRGLDKLRSVHRRHSLK